MGDFNVNETPREFIARLLRSVFEAPTAGVGAAELSRTFERNVQLCIDGRDLDWIWLVQHVQESHVQLRNVSVIVTHAVRDGNVLMDRHSVSATACDTGARWQIEVFAVYELSPEGKIRRINELTRMNTGEYAGW